MYDKRKYKEPRKDRSPLDIDYEKGQVECSFKPQFYTKNYSSKKAVSPRYNQKKEKSMFSSASSKMEAPGPHKTKLIQNYTTSKMRRLEGKYSKANNKKEVQNEM